MLSQLQAKDRELESYERLMIDSRKATEAANSGRVEAEVEAQRLAELNAHYETKLEAAQAEVAAAKKAKRALELDMETFERVKAERDALEQALKERSHNHSSLLVNLSSMS